MSSTDRSAGASPATGPFAAAALAVATGFAVWAGLSIAAGRSIDGAFVVREAWDQSNYWTFGLLAFVVAAALAGYLAPVRVWRWPLLIALGQGVAMLLVRPPGSDFALVPVAMLFVGIPLVAALTVPALAGGMVARRAWSPELFR